MASILFVCTANQYRSPIAAAHLRRLLCAQGHGDWRVSSAGTWAIPKQTPTADSMRDAAALELDLGSHVTRMVDADVLGEADLIVVMERGQKEALLTEFPACQGRTYLLAEMLQGVPFNIPDPNAYPGEHDKVLREMCEVIERAFARIVELAQATGGGAE